MLRKERDKKNRTLKTRRSLADEIKVGWEVLYKKKNKKKKRRKFLRQGEVKIKSFSRKLFPNTSTRHRAEKKRTSGSALLLSDDSVTNI
jgi:hypothetical protein